MGFGFNLVFIFVLVPISVILLLLWIIFRKKIFGILLTHMWATVFFAIALSFTIRPIWEKKVLDKDDYYGEYIIDRSYFKGKQADWQYNHFRFEITDKDSIFFHVTEEEKVRKTYTGSIYTLNPYNHSERLVTEMAQPIHHVMMYQPGTYRSIWSFYLVFRSPKFGNMFFKKGEWKAITD